jgi:hypothetical protein
MIAWTACHGIVCSIPAHHGRRKNRSPPSSMSRVGAYPVRPPATVVLPASCLGLLASLPCGFPTPHWYPLHAGGAAAGLVPLRSCRRRWPCRAQLDSCTHREGGMHCVDVPLIYPSNSLQYCQVMTVGSVMGSFHQQHQH